MADCDHHSLDDASLSCGNCGQAVCEKCARHTAVGLRCQECSTQKRAVPVLHPTERTQKRFTAGVAGSLIVMLVIPPFAILAGILFGVATSVAYRLKCRLQLLGGAVYFVAFWALAVPALVVIRPVGDIARVSVSPWTLIVIFSLALFLVPLLWRSAKTASYELVLRGRGGAAGVVISSALAATGLSIAAAPLLALFADVS